VTASTEEECDRLICVHDRELDKITHQLAELQPRTLDEVRLLLEYVQISFKGGKRTDGMDRKILENIVDSLFEVRRNIENKAREYVLNTAITVVGALASPDRNKRHA
jgi:hypothetical protein